MTRLVRARIGDRVVTVSANYAEAKDLQLLDEPARRPDGRLVPEARVNGRPVKPKTSVARKAAEKVAQDATPEQAAEGASGTDNPALEGEQS